MMKIRSLCIISLGFLVSCGNVSEENTPDSQAHDFRYVKEGIPVSEDKLVRAIAIREDPRVVRGLNSELTEKYIRQMQKEAKEEAEAKAFDICKRNYLIYCRIKRSEITNYGYIPENQGYALVWTTEVIGNLPLDILE